MQTFRSVIVALLMLALPLSAAASLTAGLRCPHQGLGDSSAMHERASTAQHTAMPHHAAMQDHVPTASHVPSHDPASGHHACDCVHHCAGAGLALAATFVAADFADRATVPPWRYRAGRATNAHAPLLRPPIATAPGNA